MSSAQVNITARDLLIGWLELLGLTGNIHSWTEDNLRDNPPRLIRLKRLMALFRAFGIHWNPASFIEGRWIDANTEEYRELFLRLTSELETLETINAEREMPTFFWELIRFRERVATVLAQPGESQLSSGLHSLALRKIKAVCSRLDTEIKLIDDLLIQLIDPKNLSFSVEQLKQDYGFPEAELAETDVPWW